MSCACWHTHTPTCLGELTVTAGLESRALLSVQGLARGARAGAHSLRTFSFDTSKLPALSELGNGANLEGLMERRDNGKCNCLPGYFTSSTPCCRVHARVHFPTLTRSCFKKSWGSLVREGDRLFTYVVQLCRTFAPLVGDRSCMIFLLFTLRRNLLQCVYRNTSTRP